MCVTLRELDWEPPCAECRGVLCVLRRVDIVERAARAESRESGEDQGDVRGGASEEQLREGLCRAAARGHGLTGQEERAEHPAQLRAQRCVLACMQTVGVAS